MNKRKVKIVLEGGNWFVKYVNRKIGGRFCAAVFTAKDHDVEYVKNWINSNPKIELIS